MIWSVWWYVNCYFCLNHFVMTPSRWKEGGHLGKSYRTRPLFRASVPSRHGATPFLREMVEQKMYLHHIDWHKFFFLLVSLCLIQVSFRHITISIFIRIRNLNLHESKNKNQLETFLWVYSYYGHQRSIPTTSYFLFSVHSLVITVDNNNGTVSRD